MKTRKVILLAMLLALPGCLKQTTPPTVDRPQIEGFERPHNGYTGAVVYGQKHCRPCRNLESDLLRLADESKWTVGDRTQGVDWTLIPESDQPSTPLVVYFVDGVKVDEASGYSNARTYEGRRGALVEIVQRHPASKRSRR